MTKLEQILEIFNSAGEWAHGGDAENVAAEWNESNLSPSRIEEWLEAGCFRAEAAFWMEEYGIEPEQASKRWDGNTLAYLVANGDMSPDKVLYIIQNSEEVAV